MLKTHRDRAAGDEPPVHGGQPVRAGECPMRGRKTERLNGPIIQAIMHSMNRTTAVRRSGTSAEIQIDQALEEQDRRDECRHRPGAISRSSTPPSTWSSNITGNPAAIVAGT